MSLGTNDVEKRWHDPRALRAATVYAVVIVALAAAAFAIYAVVDSNNAWWAVSAPAVLFLGALGAFAKTYRDWQRNRTWPVWQGAGWFLGTLALLALGIPAMGANG